MVKIRLKLKEREVDMIQRIFHNEIVRMEGFLSEQKLGNINGKVSSVDMCNTIRDIMRVEELIDKFNEKVYAKRKV